MKEKMLLEQGKVLLSDQNSSMEGSQITPQNYEIETQGYAESYKINTKSKPQTTKSSKTMYKLSRQYEQNSPTRG